MNLDLELNLKYSRILVLIMTMVISDIQESKCAKVASKFEQELCLKVRMSISLVFNVLKEKSRLTDTNTVLLCLIIHCH